MRGGARWQRWYRYVEAKRHKRCAVVVGRDGGRESVARVTFTMRYRHIDVIEAVHSLDAIRHCCDDY